MQKAPSGSLSFTLPFALYLWDYWTGDQDTSMVGIELKRLLLLEKTGWVRLIYWSNKSSMVPDSKFLIGSISKIDSELEKSLVTEPNNLVVVQTDILRPWLTFNL